MVLLLSLLAVTAYWYWTLHRRRIPDRFNTSSVPLVWSRVVKSQALAIRFTPDSKYLLAAGGDLQGNLGRYKDGIGLQDYKVRDKHLRLWNVAQRRQIEKLKAEPLFGGWNGDHMLIMPDGKTLITNSHYSNLKIIDVRKRQKDRSIDVINPGTPYVETVTSMAVSPDGNTLALGTMDGVQFYDARTFRLKKFYDHYGGNFGANVYFGRRSDVVMLVYGRSKNPHFVNVKTGQRIPAPHSQEEFGAEYSRDGKLFVEIDRDNQIELWRREGKRNIKIKTFKSTLLEIYTTQFSPNGKTLAVAGLSTSAAPVQFFDVSKIQ